MYTYSPTIPAQAQLEWLVAGNPKQVDESAWMHFENSFGALTVAEYKARGGRAEDLRSDIDRGFVRIRIYRRRRLNSPVCSS
jgi:hypothetical protein